MLGAGKSLSFETRRRGDAEPAPNELNVEREMWLDLDGMLSNVEMTSISSSTTSTQLLGQTQTMTSSSQMKMRVMRD